MKLNQILALEMGIKSRNYAEVTELNKKLQKQDLFSGFSKNYRTIVEGAEKYPSEIKIVQLLASDCLGQAFKLWTEMFDAAAAKDFANVTAKADVVIEDQVLIKDAPVPFLLYMEKQIHDIRKFVENLPSLDGADSWTEDQESGLYKTGVVSTHRTKKEQRPIVLYDATDKHPAQTQLIVEDILVGYWDTVKHSGAMPATQKKRILERINALGDAFKIAREKANMADAPAVSVGKALFDFILG